MDAWKYVKSIAQMHHKTGIKQCNVISKKAVFQVDMALLMCITNVLLF